MSSGLCPVWAITEWQCWFGHLRMMQGLDNNVVMPGSTRPEVIDEEIDLLQSFGIDQIVWAAGRSTLDYHSNIPGTTRLCERGLDGGWAFCKTVLDQVCPLRRAIECCRKRSINIHARLAVNRHYGGVRSLTSHFAADHPQWHERTRDGNPDPMRLCFAFPEVRRERIDILLELQRLGVDSLVLDFCRQFPIVRYHDAVVTAFIKEHGHDPRTLDSDDPAEREPWYRYRCEIVTQFLRELREATGSGRIIARVPTFIDWLMLAASLDVKTWLREDLIDAVMFSPFPEYDEDLGIYIEEHVERAHRFGKPCIGGIGSCRLFPRPDEVGRYQPPTSLKPVYELARRQHGANVDGLSVYQSDTLYRLDYLQPMLREITDPAVVTARLKSLADPTEPYAELMGCDWHARGCDPARPTHQALTGPQCL